MMPLTDAQFGHAVRALLARREVVALYCLAEGNTVRTGLGEGKERWTHDRDSLDAALRKVCAMASIDLETCNA